MGFRFRRSIRLGKGLRINLSKSGASLSVGRRGATVNFGPKGERVTVGVPGTGISYSSKLGAPPHHTAAALPAQPNAPGPIPRASGGVIAIFALIIGIVAIIGTVTVLGASLNH